MTNAQLLTELRLIRCDCLIRFWIQKCAQLPLKCVILVH